MTFPTVLRGKSWKFGDNIDTDQIIPAKYAIYSLDEKVLGEHAMEDVPDNEGWSKKVAKGDILVAGSNFGCGSSREIAPVAIRAAGMRFNAGHALNYANVEPIAALSGVRELHIGHAIVSRAVFTGMREAVREMKSLMTGASAR